MWKLAVLMFVFLGSSEGMARGWPEYDGPPSELSGLFLLALFIYWISKR
jgi:hypothetical protein